MFILALFPGDEVEDNDGNEYMVIAATPLEAVLELLPPRSDSYRYFVFTRSDIDGEWFDREEPAVQLSNFL